ncbi:DUF3180 domain-containing protein [Sediminivirga luteola]|uniref:Membrane protein n=1 Tax=Sediminivirga luteola TaxID=1774748 RepID=A0A8J2TUX6_9MICO|nr:DUF3180 domain-containing protein [Sediminivirga luteola]MCI2264768.1 DUF3180 domain-containing protein [Sediminivirga luteola]GGA01864.1 membrane protein [Sediminivirga luteola]
MRSTRPFTLAQLAVLGLVLSGLAHRLWESQGMLLPGVPWVAVLGLSVLSAVLFFLGWRVRAWTQGDRKRELDLLQAARVAVMAKAASLTGAGLVGWYGGAALYLMFGTGGARADTGMQMLIAVAVCLVTTVVGMIVEWFCQLPPDDGADGAEGEEPEGV